MKNIKVGYTHGGQAHMDDMASAGLLKAIFPEIQIKRLGFKEEPVYGDETIVFDVGFGEFDHHQKDHKKHEDGSSYCALSLLWEKFGMELCSNNGYMYNKIYKSVIKHIELTDTTGVQNPLSTFFRFKNASDTPIEAFNKTVEEMRFFFNGVKEECLKIAPELERAKQFYDEELDGAVYALPVDEPFIQTDIIAQLSDKILYYVHKSDRAPDNYNIIAVGDDGNNRKLIPLPGMSVSNPEEAKKLEEFGLLGVIFLHTNRFIMVCDSFSLAQIYAEVFSEPDTNNENIKTRIGVRIGVLIDAQEYTMQSISHGFIGHVISWLEENEKTTEPVESEVDDSNWDGE